MNMLLRLTFVWLCFNGLCAPFFVPPCSVILDLKELMILRHILSPMTTRIPNFNGVVGPYRGVTSSLVVCSFPVPKLTIVRKVYYTKISCTNWSSWIIREED